MRLFLLFLWKVEVLVFFFVFYLRQSRQVQELWDRVVVFRGTSLVVTIVSSKVLGIAQFPLTIFFGVWSIHFSHTIFLFREEYVAPNQISLWVLLLLRLFCFFLFRLFFKLNFLYIFSPPQVFEQSLFLFSPQVQPERLPDEEPVHAGQEEVQVHPGQIGMEKEEKNRDYFTKECNVRSTGFIKVSENAWRLEKSCTLGRRHTLNSFKGRTRIM